MVPCPPPNSYNSLTLEENSDATKVALFLLPTWVIGHNFPSLFLIRVVPLLVLYCLILSFITGSVWADHCAVGVCKC
jgi:hypothetical protein